MCLIATSKQNNMKVKDYKSSKHQLIQRRMGSISMKSFMCWLLHSRYWNWQFASTQYPESPYIKCDRCGQSW